VSDIYLRAPLSPSNDIEVRDPLHERILVEVLSGSVVRATFTVYPSGAETLTRLSLTAAEWGAIDFAKGVQVRLTKKYGPVSVLQLRVRGTDAAAKQIVDTFTRVSRPRPFAPGIAR
jgi:hypothetical protein